ncbi:hypothetical protein LY78DRAFT_652263 [Colletotrichum sublineola]|nr:hypothetical protein LY78DRAFT_652263 [Colletotrichum sublineola]
MTISLAGKRRRQLSFAGPNLSSLAFGLYSNEIITIFAKIWAIARGLRGKLVYKVEVVVNAILKPN